MRYQDAKALDGQLVVVETETSHYLGVAEVSPLGITVRSGRPGHPPVIPLFAVENVTPAAQHPLVVGA